MTTIQSPSRRRFLRLGAQVLGSGSLLATLGGMQRVLAAADTTTGYRALVCVFLYGGNDGFNLLVPRDTTNYNAYRTARRGLALAQGELLPIAPTNIQSGLQYGLHPAASGIQSLFEEGRAAFIANVGTLIEPVTAAQYANQSRRLPPYLFSHSDQAAQWMTSYPQASEPYGWAGRVADLLDSQGYNPRLSMNVSIAGSNIWQGGAATVPYALGARGAEQLALRNASRMNASFNALLAQSAGDSHLMVKEYTTIQNRSTEFAGFISDSLAQTAQPTTEFPEGGLGAQLRMVAHMIKARSRIGVSRQMFFVAAGDWDHHADLLRRHNTSLTELSACLRAFQTELDLIGAQGDVTTFTASDFGRTLTSNGDGSDHGWATHSLVMGGAVDGRKIYGRVPNLTIDGPDDAGFGRIIPSISTDQLGSTLARWFGVTSDADLNTVFPNLANFTTRNLGFIRA